MNNAIILLDEEIFFAKSYDLIYWCHHLNWHLLNANHSAFFKSMIFLSRYLKDATPNACTGKRNYMHVEWISLVYSPPFQVCNSIISVKYESLYPTFVVYFKDYKRPFFRTVILKRDEKNQKFRANVYLSFPKLNINSSPHLTLHLFQNDCVKIGLSSTKTIQRT
jgi:hypothetical protein